MSTKGQTNNERLRQLVEGTGFSQPIALVIFNRGLGAAGYSESAWKSFLAAPESKRFRRFSDALLKHAERAFAKHQTPS